MTLFFGLWLLFDYAWAYYGNMLWLHLKLVLVVVLFGYQMFCGKLLRDLESARKRSATRYRWSSTSSRC